MKKLYRDLLGIFVFLTTMPVLMWLLFKIVFKGNQENGMIAAMFVPAFCIVIGYGRCYKAEYSRGRVVLLALIFAFFVEMSCLVGFIFLSKVILGGSLLNEFWANWLAGFCVISVGSVYWSLRGWKREKSSIQR